MTSDGYSSPLSADLFKLMLTIRMTEETLLDLFSRGELRGTIHTCVGQEACAAGVAGALEPSRDVVCSNHRGHGHYLAFTGDVEGLLAEVMGKQEGVCGGIGGSQHLHRKNFYSNGILAGMVPVAAGMALAEKNLGTGGLVAVFLGDGAFGEGVVYETLNLAALWKLPLLFAVESNGYAQSTPTHLEHAGDLSTRCASAGIPMVDLDGNDAIGVRTAAREAAAAIRAGCGPRLLFLRTYRLGPHSKGDDPRDPREIEAHRKNDPIHVMEKSLAPEQVVRIKKEAGEKIAEILGRIRSAAAVKS